MVLKSRAQNWITTTDWVILCCNLKTQMYMCTYAHAEIALLWTPSRVYTAEYSKDLQGALAGASSASSHESFPALSTRPVTKGLKWSCFSLCPFLFKWEQRSKFASDYSKELQMLHSWTCMYEHTKPMAYHLYLWKVGSVGRPIERKQKKPWKCL